MSKTYMVIALPDGDAVRVVTAASQPNFFERAEDAWEECAILAKHDSYYRRHFNLLRVIAIDNETGDVEKCERPEDEYMIRIASYNDNADGEGWLCRATGIQIFFNGGSARDDDSVEIHKRRADGSGYDRLTDEQVRASTRADGAGVVTKDVSKLPKWAQFEIESLRGENARLRQQVSDGPEDSNTFLSGLQASEDRPLGRDVGISFLLAGEPHHRIDVRQRVGSLDVQGSGPLIILPIASNHFTICSGGLSL